MNAEGKETGTTWGLEALSDSSATDVYFESLTSVALPNRVVSWVMDPTGRYVLLVVWERTAVPTGEREFSTDYVTDSVLLLIDWRTKTSREWLRLSDSDTSRIVARDVAWSADGSTVLVPRQDAPPLVLKVKYP